MDELKEKQEFYQRVFGRGEGLEDEQTYESIRIEPGLYLAALGKVGRFEAKSGSSGISADMILLTKTPVNGGETQNLVATTKEINGVRDIEPVKDKAGTPIVSNIIFTVRFWEPNASTSAAAKNFQNYFRRSFAKQFGALADDGKIHWKEIASRVGTIVTFELSQRKNSQYVNMEVDSFSVIPNASISPVSLAKIYDMVAAENGEKTTESGPDPDLPF